MRSAAMLFLALAVLGVPPAAAHPQQYELGVQLSGLRLAEIEEGPVGVGVRFHYNVTDHLAADLQATHFPENPSGNFGETAAFAGIRAGVRGERLGLFGKVRPGLIHFGGAYFDLRLDDRTYPVLDVGAVFELYFADRYFLRVETGDTMIFFGGAEIRHHPPASRLDTTHNRMAAVGLGVRF